MRDKFVFYGTKGATYNVLSSSYFDPYVLLVYDNLGNVISFDQGGGTYGYDYANIKAPYSGMFYLSASWNQGLASGHQAVAIAVYEDLDTIPPRAKNAIEGTAGNDRLVGTAANDQVNGGAGIDTFVVSGKRADYVYSGDGVAITLSDRVDVGAADRLQGIERITFSDVTVSFEATGIPAQAYRLYQAAFGRTPDKGGLGHWIKVMEAGMSLNDVANFFVNSPEFAELYKGKSTTTDILTGVYKNVLHRAPDAGGLEFWSTMLDSKKISLATMLESFSESPENQAQVIGSLHSGYEFLY